MWAKFFEGGSLASQADYLKLHLNDKSGTCHIATSTCTGVVKSTNTSTGGQPPCFRSTRTRTSTKVHVGSTNEVLTFGCVHKLCVHWKLEPEPCRYRILFILNGHVLFNSFVKCREEGIAYMKHPNTTRNAFRFLRFPKIFKNAFFCYLKHSGRTT